MKIHYFGHSALALEADGHCAILDPFISGNPHMHGKPLPKELKIDNIILSHAHNDHSGDAEVLSKKFAAPITAVFELAEHFSQRGCKVIACGLGGRIDYNWGWSRFVPAFHSSSLDGQPMGNAAGIVLNIGGITVYHAGDTCVFGDMKLIGQLYKPQVAFLPIGGHFTMDIFEAKMAAQLLGAPLVVPIHYGTFPPVAADPQEFRRQVEADQANIKVKVIAPGQIETIA